VDTLQIDLDGIGTRASAPIALLVAGALSVTLFQLMGSTLKPHELPFLRLEDGSVALNERDAEAIYQLAESMRIDQAVTNGVTTSRRTH
jgi:hypothetical protein